MKDTDIIAAIAPDAVSLMDKAIAEIKRLRQENATLTAERDEARRQRDQARRTLCKVLVITRPPGSTQDQHGFAKEMGWDCFPQEDGK